MTAVRETLSMGVLSEGPTQGFDFDRYDREVFGPELTPEVTELSALRFAVGKAFDLSEGQILARFYSFNRTVTDEGPETREDGGYRDRVTSDLVVHGVIRNAETGKEEIWELPLIITIAQVRLVKTRSHFWENRLKYLMHMVSNN